MTGESAAITGIGLVTAAGLGTRRNWTAIREATPTTRDTHILDGFPVTFASTVPDHFDVAWLTGSRSAAHNYDRNTQFALVAAQAALSDAGLTGLDGYEARTGVILGTSLGMQAMESDHARMLERGHRGVKARSLAKWPGNMPPGILGIELGATGPNMTVCTACASGATAIGTALTMLRSGAADIVITGGTDASITPLFASGFDKLGALTHATKHPAQHASRPFDADHDGVVLGEGAGILVLERADHAAARGATPYAHLAGHASTADAHHVSAPHPDGAGAREAIRKACHDAGISPSEVGHVNAHATSTPAGDAVEARVLTDLTPHAAVTSTKGVTGHAICAAGGIEAAYTALALRHQIIPPVANLNEPCAAAKDLDISATARGKKFDIAVSNSFGFGGQNTSLVFTR